MLAAATAVLPSTRLRIPMVNGEHDHKRRLESYLWRLLDGGPLLVPEAGATARHVYSGAVVGAILRLLESPPPAGQAFNLAQAEQPTVRALIERLAARVGARPTLLEVPAAAVEAAGLEVRAASPLSSRWMSLIDPARAVAELGFVHPPLDVYLDSIVASLLAAWPASPPPATPSARGSCALPAPADEPGLATDPAVRYCRRAPGPRLAAPFARAVRRRPGGGVRRIAGR